jgi:hypothetical protein
LVKLEMASRTQQSDQIVPPFQRASSIGTTFRVDRYELGLDVSLDDRYVTVDIIREGGEVRAAVLAPTEWWVCEIAGGEVTDGRQKELESGDERRLDRVPRWVEVVLQHVGVARWS